MAEKGEALQFSLIRRMYRYVQPYRGTFYLAVFLTLSLAVLSPTRPWLIQYALDEYAFKGNTPGLLNMILLLVGILLIQTILQYYHTYITSWLGQTAIKDIRKQLFSHLLSLRLKYFDHTPIGQLVTRVISDLETIADVFSEGLISIIGDLLQVLAIIAVMFYIDWKLALIVLSTLPFLILATYIFKEKIKSAFGEVRTEVAQLNTFLQEHITGMSIVQLFAREKAEMDKFDAINKRHRTAHIRSVWYYSIFFPVVELISALSIGLLVWFGGIAALEGSLSVGVIVSFILYVNMLFRPIRELADKFNTLQMGMVSAERIFKVLDAEEQTPDTGTFIPAQLSGKIEFKNVWFAYKEEDWVLKDVSFTLESGQTLALVGATGAGKSSIINLINRFYEINKGEILLDGRSIKEYPVPYLRSRIATVLQDVFLFFDTIANNISLHNPDISRASIENAAVRVGADSFIRSLRAGYDFPVTERGGNLSSGQAQLISFIRALVYDPRVLVLDEATSSIDTETEQLIQQAINTLMEGRTSIVIAHRLSTIQHAHTILLLDKGEVKESGSHQALLAIDGYYKRLYDLQFSSVGIRA